VSISEAFTVDTTPPITGTIHIGDMSHITNFLPKASLIIHLRGFDDKESGLDGFWISVVSEDGEVAAQPTLFVTDVIQLPDSMLSSLVDGHTYRVVCRVCFQLVF